VDVDLVETGEEVRAHVYRPNDRVVERGTAEEPAVVDGEELISARRAEDSDRRGVRVRGAPALRAGSTVVEPEPIVVEQDRANRRLRVEVAGVLHGDLGGLPRVDRDGDLAGGQVVRTSGNCGCRPAPIRAKTWKAAS